MYNCITALLINIFCVHNFKCSFQIKIVAVKLFCEHLPVHLVHRRMFTEKLYKHYVIGMLARIF